MLTTTEAAQYLKERGYTVKLRKRGNEVRAVEADTLKHWCIDGKFPGAYKVGVGNRATWLIPQSDLDALLASPPAPPSPSP
jgi:hypothetical protein